MIHDKISWLYSVGTLLVWGGWFLAFMCLLGCLKLVLRIPGLDKAKSLRGLVTSGFVAAVFFILGTTLTSHPMASSLAPSLRKPAPLKLPVIWVVAPFVAWLALVSFTMVLTRLVQAGLSITPLERINRLKNAGGWLLVMILGIFFYHRDKTNSIKPIEGAIPFQIATVVILGCICVAAASAMILAGREAATRGLAKAVVAQLTLIVGSIVFGIPFVFLLITSFKEPEDMSSPDGIVWVPKVSKTVLYMDKKDPQYVGTYNGMDVTGHIIGTNPDGTFQFDILRPHGLSGISMTVVKSAIKEVPKDAPVVSGKLNDTPFTGEVIEEMEDGRRRVSFLSPASLLGKEQPFAPADLHKVKDPGPNWRNYPDALEFLPPEADRGLVYLKNTLIIVILNVLGTILSSAIVAYAFSRMNFPGKNALFAVLLSTMMLPGAVTLLPTFLIFRDLHSIDTLVPLWMPAFFGSAFNIFLLRQFLMQIPMELEDAAKIDGCTYLKTFWAIMLPQIKPALAVIAIWTFMGSWNNFMGPLIYISSPEHMPLSYALQLFQSDRGGDEPGLVMAFATLCMVPVLALFFACQRYFIEGVTLSGLGGR